MEIRIEAIETAFEVTAVGPDYVILTGMDEDKTETVHLPVGETFHIAYDGNLKLGTLLWALLTGQPLRLPARDRCNCRWDKKVEVEQPL